MGWQIDNKRPICPQICEQLSVKISSGEFKAGEKLLSVRDVALEAGVNPNTVQKSFEKLEESGLIYSKRGSGWFVSENISIANEQVESIIINKIKAFIDDMIKLNISKEQIIELIKETKDE